MKKIYVLVFLITLVSLQACSDQSSSSEISIKPTNEIIGLATPIRLQPEVTKIWLRDYFDMQPKIDSVVPSSSSLLCQIVKDTLIISSEADLPPLSNLDFYIEDQINSIPVYKSTLHKYTYTFKPNKKYTTVQLKGEMNAWNPQTLELKDDKYTLPMLLGEKGYQYILILDGEETLDYNNPLTRPNDIGGTNSFLNPFGGKALGKLELICREIKEGWIYFDYNEKPTGAFAYWNNQALPLMFEFNSLKVQLPKNAFAFSEAYVRVFASNANKRFNDVLLPFKNGELIQNAEELKRTDPRSFRMYNVFVDRFSNGDPANDRPLRTRKVHPKANDYGGDIKGITDQINNGFFENNGINTIWISPIVKNAEGAYGSYPKPKTKFSAYHGYWPISFTLIDDRKGTETEFKQMVKVAHRHGINVLLDFVANHVHEEHPYYKAHPDKVTDLHLPDGRENTQLWDEHRLTTWFDTFMPSLKLDDPEVYNMLTDSAVYWIEKYNLDGFRHDATKHVPEIFWQTLTYKIKQRVVRKDRKPIYQIGETYGTPALINSYVNTGQLDAQFDFNLYDAIVHCLVHEDGTFNRFNNMLQESLMTYGSHNLMGNITGNQDRARFISYAAGDLDLAEDSKLAGWTREVGISDTSAFDKQRILFGIINAIPGVPVVYYGDEYGSYGGNDPDNRKMMKFENYAKDEAQLLFTNQKLLNYRALSMPLLYGDTRVLDVNEDFYVLCRSYLTSHVVCAFNKSDQEITRTISLPFSTENLELNTVLGNIVKKVGRHSVDVTLPPNSLEFIELK